MERDKRLYPINEERFNELVLPIIEGSYIGKGRPPETSQYARFSTSCGRAYPGGTCRHGGGQKGGCRAKGCCAVG